MNARPSWRGIQLHSPVMFLDMLTADAASKHGHEFSDPQPARRMVPRRSPFRVLPYAARQRLPTRSKSVRIAMGDLKEEPEETEDTEKDIVSTELPEMKIPGSYNDEPHSPDLPAFALPDIVQTLTPIDSTPTPTPVPEPLLVPRAPSPPLKRTHRSRTQYRLAHPPPSTRPLRRQGILRPKVLLQFQQLSLSGFHKPIYEVVPMSRFDTGTKMGQKLRRLEKGKHSLTAEDLVVMRVADYSTADTVSDHIEDSDCRDVLGVISSIPSQDKTRPGAVQILLENSLWEATPGKDGIFDLILQGEKPQFARWYIPKSRRRTSRAEGTEGAVEERKFYFTAILPNCKKHPTIASMSEGHLDIYDSYTVTSDMPSDVPWLPVASPPEEVPPIELEGDKKKAPETVPTDDLLRKLIIVSSSWVAFCESWSPHFKYTASRGPSRDPSPSCRPSMSIRPLGQTGRSASMPISPSGFGLSPEVVHDRAQSVPLDKAGSTAQSSRTHTPLSSLTPSQRASPPPSLTPPSLGLEVRPELLKRSTFAGFSLRRTNSTGKRKASLGFRSHSIQTDIGPQVQPLQPTPAADTPLPTDAEETPLTKHIEVADSELADPTSQFRQLSVLEKPECPTPSPAPRPRAKTLIRRSSEATTAINIDTRRSRRHIAKWTWHSPLENFPARRERVPPRSRPTSITVDKEDATILALGRMAADSTSVASNSQSVDTESTTLAGSPPRELNDRPRSASTSHFTDAFEIQPEDMNAIHDPTEHNEMISHVEEHKSIPSFENTALISQPVNIVATEESEALAHPPSPDTPSSSESELDGFGGPYWKDFDRIQSRAFRDKAKQLQTQPDVITNPAVTADSRDDEGEAGAGFTEEARESRGNWLFGLRRSVSRRKKGYIKVPKMV